MIELKKCTNELCRRAVKTSVAYCCASCDRAAERGYEIHETGLLGHTEGCEIRHAERGDYRDPWAPPPLGQHTCWSCGGSETTYAAFSGGHEYYCTDCDDNFPYEEGTAPRRVQMLADGRTDELREEMRDHLRHESETTMRARPGQWVTGQTVVSDHTVTGKVLRWAATVLDNGLRREVLVVSDMEQPHLRAPFHVFADTVTVHGRKPGTT